LFSIIAFALKSGVPDYAHMIIFLIILEMSEKKEQGRPKLKFNKVPCHELPE